MSDHNALILHTVMILALACLLLMIVRNQRGELQAIHDRMDTQWMNGNLPEIPVMPEPKETPDAG